jgi:chromosome segregation ATPase
VLEKLRAQHSEELSQAQQAHDALLQQKEKIEQQLALGGDDKDQELLALRQQLGAVLAELSTAKEAHAEVQARQEQESQVQTHAASTQRPLPLPVPALAEEQLQALQNLYTEQMGAANKAHAEVAAAREELTSILADMDQRHDEHDAEVAELQAQLAAAEDQFEAEAAQRQSLEARLAAAAEEREEQRAILDATQAKLRAAEAERDEALGKVAELAALLAASGDDRLQLEEALAEAEFKLVRLAATTNAPQEEQALAVSPTQQKGARSPAGQAESKLNPEQLDALEEAEVVLQEKAALEMELANLQAKVITLEAELQVAADGAQRVRPHPQLPIRNHTPPHLIKPRCHCVSTVPVVSNG